MEAERAGRIVGQVVLGLLCGGLVLVAVAMAASIADRSDVPVEAISGTTVAVAFGSAALVVLGVIAAAVTANRDILFLSAAATALVLVSIAGMFSVGILILPLAIGSIYLLVRQSSGRTALVRPVLSGVAIAVGMAALSVVWVQPPLVECTPRGATTSSRPWWGSGGTTGEGTGGIGRTSSTGSIDTPSGRYVFSCRDGELTQFRRMGGS